MIKQLFERYLNYLRELSYQHSDECLQFTRTKLQAHRYFMISARTTNPYLHPDDWQDEEVTYSQIFK